MSRATKQSDERNPQLEANEANKELAGYRGLPAGIFNESRRSAFTSRIELVRVFGDSLRRRLTYGTRWRNGLMVG